MLLAFVVAFFVSGALAIAGEELGRPALRAVFKPLTTALLFAVIGWPGTPLARAVAAGLLLSLVGDVVLMSTGQTAFLIGLGAFVLAHLAYIFAFVATGMAAWSPGVAVVVVLAGAVTALLLRAIWNGAAGMRAASVVYGAVITAMVTAAWATLGGRLAWAPLAAAGAVLFYASDALLALNRFRRPIPHAPFLTVGVYWLGQLGIALAARGGLR
jgi:uncharacterized membrane protein YhhN